MNPRTPRFDSSPIDSFTAAPAPPELQNPPPSQASSPAIQTQSQSSLWQQTLNSRAAILGTLFLITGAIGLPLLWYSPVFSQLEKWIWSAIALIYTAALIGVTWAVVVWCYRIISGAF